MIRSTPSGGPDRNAKREGGTPIDGPFTETKELIAGYVIIQVKSREAAIEWTKRFVQLDAPGRHGAESECEVRQILELEDFPVDPAE